jgi:hypothetical protein
MTQSLSSVAPGAEVHLHSTGAFPLRGQDHLARLGLEAIASWSNVESAILNLYADLGRSDRGHAISQFLALETNSARAQALSLLGKYLSEPAKPHFERLVELFRSRAKARDRLAHWVWGSAPLVQHALLLCDPAVLAAQNPAQRIDVSQVSESILVFREKDFLEIISANERLAAYARKLRSLAAITCDPLHPAEADEAYYALEGMLPEFQ